MSFGTKTICPVCGSNVVQNGKGRTKDYCSDACRDFNKFLSATETAFLKIQNIERSNKKIIRSKFWSLANILNTK